MKVAVEMPLADYWRAKHPNGKPTLRAYQKMCARGDVPAVKRGSWYVLVEEAESMTGNELVDAVLKAG